MTSQDWLEDDADDEEDAEDSSSPILEDLDSVNEQQLQLALLPDGSALQLTGPGGGSVVQAGLGTISTRIPSRDEALDGSSPLLLVHRPHQHSGLIPRALGQVLAATNEPVRLGAVTTTLRATTESNTSWLADCGAASVRIVDPVGYRLDSGFIMSSAISTRGRRWAPYLTGDPLSIAAVLEAQRSAGANLLLSPGRGVNAANPQTSLDDVFRDADQALAELKTGERLGLYLTLSRSWLSQPPLRDQLLDYLLDQEQFDIWYIRVQWPSSLRSTEQSTDLALLEGYKRLAQLAADEERTLLLPNTGLTGWLQLGFGAAGLGSGLAGSDQAFKEPAGGGGGAPIERYFEPTLLHCVERTVHEALRRGQEYVPCSCPYCPALHTSGDWRHELAALHQFHWLGVLTAEAVSSSRGGAGGAVRRRVRAAVAAAAGQPLTGLSEPRHLPIWDRLL